FTKRGEPYALFRLEDLTGGVGIVAFPSAFDKAADLVALDRIVLVKGRADLRGRELQLVALEISEPNLSGGGGAATRPPGSATGSAPGSAPAPSDPLLIDIPARSCTGGLVLRLKGLLSMYPGPLPVVVRLVADRSVQRLRLGGDHCVDGSPAL